uniref:Protein P n=3 Tax=Cacopsylla melanoneura TaxID=428564 RepID=A0A8D8TT41_9HEMI
MFHAPLPQHRQWTCLFSAREKKGCRPLDLDLPRSLVPLLPPGLSSTSSPKRTTVDTREGTKVVGGRLRFFTDSWIRLGAPPALVKIISGYSIPFSARPPLAPLGISPQFCTPVSPEMSAHIRSMQATGVLTPIHTGSGFLSRMFLVPKGDGSTRPVLNLKRLNLFLSPRKFQLVSQFKIPSFLQQGDYLIKLDLSQAYFHVPVKETHQRFLALSYNGTLLAMTCLPFGLATAPQAFASLSNWVASLLRKRGMRVVVYLDDFCLANQDPLVLKEQGRQVVLLLEELGWIVNFPKSSLTPSPALQFLGIMWDPHQDLKWLPLVKQEVLRNLILSLLHVKVWELDSARSLLGHLGFASFVIPLGRLHSRRVQRQAMRLRPLQPVPIHSSVLSELDWWLGSLGLGSSIFPREFKSFVSTDASDLGWGAQVNNTSQAGLWPAEQRDWHINRKEMYAVRQALSLNLARLKDSAVMIQSDNQTVVSYLCRQGGTRSLALLLVSTPSPAVQHTHISSVYPGDVELICRQPVPTETPPRLASPFPGNSTHISEMGGPSRGSVCLQGFSHCSQVCDTSLDRSASPLCRCILKGLGLPPCLGIPTSGSHAPSPAPPEQCQGPIHRGGSPLGEGVLEARPDDQGHPSSHSDHRSGQVPDRPNNGEAPTQGGIPAFGGMACAGWMEETAAWEPADKQLLLTAWRPSTLRTYQAPWRRWLSWARKHGVVPNDPSPSDLGRYLCSLHRVEKLAYSSILVHKSVVCTFAKPSQSALLSSHPLVTHTLKAISSLSPRPARKIWSVNSLVDWIRANPPCPSSHFQTSRHVALLLLLSSGRRVHDLTLLSLEPGFFQVFENFIVFWPRFGAKTDSNTHAQSGWKILSDPNNHLFDIPSWIQKLVNLSLLRSGAIPLLSLFISTRGRVRPASRSVIAGWVKTALAAAGIQASAGSVRSAVSSFKFDAGVPLDSILRQGNWQGGQNFFKFYYKPISGPRPTPTSVPTVLNSFEPV